MLGCVAGTVAKQQQTTAGRVHANTAVVTYARVGSCPLPCLRAGCCCLLRFVRSAHCVVVVVRPQLLLSGLTLPSPQPSCTYLAAHTAVCLPAHRVLPSLAHIACLLQLRMRCSCLIAFVSICRGVGSTCVCVSHASNRRQRAGSHPLLPLQSGPPPFCGVCQTVQCGGSHICMPPDMHR